MFDGARENGRSLPQLIFHGEIYGQRPKRCILRTLLKSTCRKYNRSLSFPVKDLMYDGNIYFSDYEKWFSNCYKNNVPHLMNTNLRRSDLLIQDTLIHHSRGTRLNDTAGVEKGCYVDSLFVLTVRRLIRYSIHQDSFTECENIFLGDDFRFEQLSYDAASDRLILKSKDFSIDSHIVFHFAIFSASPLEFIGVIPLSNDMQFGRILDSYICSGMLAVTSYHSQQEKYTFYDLEFILEHLIIEKYDIGQSIGDTQEIAGIIIRPDVVGSMPYGLPVNFDMFRVSPSTYEVYSHFAESVTFGGFPWYSLTTQAQRSGNAHLHNITSGNLVAMIGSDDSPIDDFMNDRIPVFQGDNSGRILKVNHNSIVSYKVVDRPVGNLDSNLEECFRLSFSTNSSTNRQPQVPYSWPDHRVIGHLQSGYIAMKSDIVHAIDFDSELNVIVVLFTSSPLEIYKVGIYDNGSGEVIRKIDIIEEPSENDYHEWHIHFNNLLLICICKFFTGDSICSMYQLDEID